MRGRDRRERHRDMAAEQIGQRRAGALVGNMHQRDAGGAGEIFAGDVAGGAGAGRAEIDLAGIGLGVGDQLGDGFGRKRRMHHQRIRRVADQADRRKILARIVADVLVERRPDRERAGIAEHQRVAVGLALRDRLGADGAAGAGPVVDHDLFAEQFAHLVGDAAADDRGAAARRERNHQRDRPARIVLRLRLMERLRLRRARQWRRQAAFSSTAISATPPSTFVIIGRIVVKRFAISQPCFRTTKITSRRTPAVPARRRGYRGPPALRGIDRSAPRSARGYAGRR